MKVFENGGYKTKRYKYFVEKLSRTFHIYRHNTNTGEIILVYNYYLDNKTEVGENA